MISWSRSRKLPRIFVLEDLLAGREDVVVWIPGGSCPGATDGIQELPINYVVVELRILPT